MKELNHRQNLLKMVNCLKREKVKFKTIIFSASFKFSCIFRIKIHHFLVNHNSSLLRPAQHLTKCILRTYIYLWNFVKHTVEMHGTAHFHFICNQHVSDVKWFNHLRVKCMNIKHLTENPIAKLCLIVTDAPFN